MFRLTRLSAWTFLQVVSIERMRGKGSIKVMVGRGLCFFQLFIVSLPFVCHATCDAWYTLAVQRWLLRNGGIHRSWEFGGGEVFITCIAGYLGGTWGPRFPSSPATLFFFQWLLWCIFSQTQSSSEKTLSRGCKKLYLKDTVINPRPGRKDCYKTQSLLRLRAFYILGSTPSILEFTIMFFSHQLTCTLISKSRTLKDS